MAIFHASESWINISNFFDFIFDIKISVPKQSIQDKDLFKPHDVWFAPNNHLVAVSDIGDKSVKIFSLEGDQGQVNQFVIGYNVTRNLIVQDVNAIKKELSSRSRSRIQLNLETVWVSLNIYMVGQGHLFPLIVLWGTDRMNKVL